ncbi:MULTISPECIES: hypothetical protein [Saccharibacillus]|uniref:hypothetical protein n=1 Tax=Saccharibacillus TaxID=456492 RepID=UPI00123B8B0B|nr:hypothetical protein [Saccharibacillus sp. WB 17]MWJ31902.1 hypothetical protein [Saccharibacillus sp. WB 17]
MFTTLLQTKDYEVIEEIPSVDGDEKYLIQEDNETFHLLSDFSSVEYLLTTSEDMPDLIKELDLLLGQVQSIESLEHLRRIKQLAKKCKNLKGSFLIITPFEVE